MLPLVAVLTLLSGLRLLMLASNGFDGAYFGTGAGRTFSTSGGLAILAFAFGMTVSRPASMRAAAFGGRLAAAPDDAARAALGAELARLRSRAATLNLVTTALIVLAAAGMAVARYVR